MRKRGTLRAPAALAIPLLVLSFSAAPVLAEDLKGKFYVGGGLGVLVTNDNIRSNAALIVAPLGNDGAPFTGDQGEEVACTSNRVEVFCDPRPDDLIARQTTLDTSPQANLRIGYGLTSLISLEFSAGYFEGDISNLDVFTTKRIPISTNPTDPCLPSRSDPNFDFSNACDLRRLSGPRGIKEPITAGKLTEIPLELNALVRFRKDSNLNPYLGGGIGYLITDLEVSDNIDKLNERFEKLHLINTYDEFGPLGRSLIPQDLTGNAEFKHPAEVTVTDGFQWQFVGGMDYFFSDRFSLHFEAKYVLARDLPWSGEDDSHKIEIFFNGEDQINLYGFPEDMYHPNGNLKIFNQDGGLPNPSDPNTGLPYDCDPDNDGFDDFGKNVDYDGDGQFDKCYTKGVSGGSGDPEQTVVAQGGIIRLTNYTFGFGIKFHF